MKGNAVDKSVLGLLGGASALALVSGGAASAAASHACEASGLKPAQSFAELLDPIPNAVITLRAQEETGNAGSEPLQLAQYYYYGYPHHHHHHHHHWRHHHHHHHHHHHQHYVAPY